MANYFVKKNESFLVTLPFNVQDEENPQIIFGLSLKTYVDALQACPEEKIEYHWCKFRRLGFGLDCYIRELSYMGTGASRTLSEDHLSENRLAYCLLGSSFYKDASLTFTKDGAYDILSSDSKEYIQSLNPLFLKAFLLIASRVWDEGMPPKNLLSVEDYKLLRNDDDGVKLVMEAHGLLPKDLVESDTLKKMLSSEQSKHSSPPASPTTTA